MPAMVFHLVYNALLMAPLLAPQTFAGLEPTGTETSLLRLLLSAGCAALAALGLAFVWRRGVAETGDAP